MTQSRIEAEANPADVALGAQIRRVRKAQNMSQERLAAASGVSFQQIQKYERGLNRVSFSRLMRIAAALETPVRNLVAELEDPAQEPRSFADLMRTPGSTELMATFAALPNDAVRREVVALVQVLSRDADRNADPGSPAA